MIINFVDLLLLFNRRQPLFQLAIHGEIVVQTIAVEINLPGQLFQTDQVSNVTVAKGRSEIRITSLFAITARFFGLFFAADGGKGFLQSSESQHITDSPVIAALVDHPGGNLMAHRFQFFQHLGSLVAATDDMNPQTTVIF